MRRAARQRPSTPGYKANLAIVEAPTSVPDTGSTAAVTHAVGALLSAANGRSYGFMLSDRGDGEVLMIDLKAFLDAPAKSAGSHELAATPFDGTIIKNLPLGPRVRWHAGRRYGPQNGVTV